MKWELNGSAACLAVMVGLLCMNVALFCWALCAREMYLLHRWVCAAWLATGAQRAMALRCSRDNPDQHTPVPHACPAYGGTWCLSIEIQPCVSIGDVLVACGMDGLVGTAWVLLNSFYCAS